MDKDLEKILKKANDLNAPEQKSENPSKTFPPNDRYDHLVFTKLCAFSGFSWIPFLILIPSAMCVGFFIFGFSATMLYVFLGYFSLMAVYLLVNYFRYIAFIGWQEKLPFALEGWEEMIRTKKMFCDLCWNDTRLEVSTEGEDSAVKQLTEAALSLFCDRSKKAFYTAKMFGAGKRSRQDWKMVSPVSAEGSASPQVMRYMKDLFENELSVIARKTGKIKAVKVTLLSGEFEVKIHIDSGD